MLPLRATGGWCLGGTFGNGLLGLQFADYVVRTLVTIRELYCPASGDESSVVL